MINTKELALSPLPEVWVTNDYAKKKPKLANSWKALVFLAIIILTFASLPRQAASEITLSQDVLLQLINQDRAKLGLRPLHANLKLVRAANAKAEHMLRNSYFSHTAPSGLTPWDFIKDQALSFSFAGENLAMNYTSSYELEQAFLKSPSHRENLLSSQFSQIGIAAVAGTYQNKPAILTVEMFSSP